MLHDPCAIRHAVQVPGLDTQCDADGLEVAIRAGVTAAIQPGGSKRDDEVVAAADAADVAMVFTGRRHFRH